VSTIIFALLFTAIVFGLIMFVRKYPSVIKYTAFFSWVVQVVRVTVDHWGFDKKYSDQAVLASHYFSLASTAAVSGDLREVRRRVASLVSFSYRRFYPLGSWTEEDERISAAAYVALVNHQNIRDVATSLERNYRNIEVRKATYLAIDVLGELVDLSDDLGQEYFQHLIYGINKSLVLIKENGTDKKSLKKVTSTLFRVYKLSRAYRHLRSLDEMTEKEFYEKINGIFDSLSRMFD